MYCQKLKQLIKLQSKAESTKSTNHSPKLFSLGDSADQKSNVMMTFSSSLPALKLAMGKIPNPEEIKMQKITGKHCK